MAMPTPAQATDTGPAIASRTGRRPIGMRTPKTATATTSASRAVIIPVTTPARIVPTVRSARGRGASRISWTVRCSHSRATMIAALSAEPTMIARMTALWAMKVRRRTSSARVVVWVTVTGAACGVCAAA